MVMATFPRTEPEILALAQAMEAGLMDNDGIYPAPPVTLLEFGGLKNAYLNRRNLATAAQAMAEQAIATKDDALDALVEGMKSDLRYAENTVNFDDAQLKLIGWGGRSAATALAVPGQSRLLEAPKQGEGWVFLDWKAPSDGGKVAAYKVMRRERPAGSWQNVATAIDSEATLVEQPRNTELEYQIIAVNKSGEGEPSNMVLAVL
ncbi:MAG: hypothetical protein PHF37_04795 [Phycisphaerae bacterium]|nr:hypothetical protein [Phycisphaerae bacterium]